MTEEKSACKNWLTENNYEFEKDTNGNLFIIKSDTNSEISITKTKLPDNSVTKGLLVELRKINAI